MTDLTADPKMATTALGDVEYTDAGEGSPVLFVHGSPGGCDQGVAMGRFLVDAGFRVVSPSRPGYLNTPLTADNATPAQQAELEAALMDALGIDRFGLLCWSGGGPSSYLLAATHPDRVSALVAIAAVSNPYTFEHPLVEDTMLFSRPGSWLMNTLVHHAPKTVVKMLPPEEGHLTKGQAKELINHIWEDPTRRDFVLDLTETITGDRKSGVHNDAEQFPRYNPDLTKVTVPVLLVHAATDADVPVDQSEHAVSLLPVVDYLRIEVGTHLSVWTDDNSAEIQDRIAAFLRS